jgi:NADH-quinone oxidoreductase subunit C
MSADHHAAAPAAQGAYPAIKPGKSKDQLLELLAKSVAATADPADRWDLTVVVARDRLRECLTRLRDDAELRFDTLLDISGTDYLSYPDHRAERFAVTYVLKSTVFRHRIAIKVRIDEEDATVPSVHDLFKIADYAERETWDQYGIVFAGHPNLKRLLNHHEFSGHPLRKDYPCQKRQKLSLNDPMLDQLEENLRAKGWEIIESGAVEYAKPMTTKAGAP